MTGEGMSGETQAIEFSLTARDFWAYNMAVMRRMRWFRWGRIAVVVFLGFLIAMNLFTYWQIGEWEDGTGLWILFFLGAVFYPQLIRLTSWLRFRSAAFAKIRAPIRIEISPAGLRSAGGLAESLTPWSSILDVVVTKDAAYLFIFKNVAHIVPWHAFADQAAFDRFVSAARGFVRLAGPAHGNET